MTGRICPRSGKESSMADQLSDAELHALREIIAKDQDATLFKQMHDGAMAQLRLAKQLQRNAGIDSDQALRTVQSVLSVNDAFLDRHGRAALATFDTSKAVVR